MKLATTTEDFIRFLGSYDSVSKIHEAGFKYIDLCLDLREAYFSTDGSWQDEVKRLKEHADELGIKFVQAHSPNSNVLDALAWDSELFMAERSLEICKMLGIENVVVHAGYQKNLPKKDWYEGNAKFYRALFPAMEKTGVTVLTENTTRNNIRDTFFIYTGSDMAEFIDYIDHPLFAAVWDTGHGIGESTQYDSIMALGDKLRAIHVHDNSGRADEHAFLYTGLLNVDDLMNGLIDSGYKGYFTFEVVNGLQPSGGRIKREKFARDTRLFEPTLDMQMAAERFLFAMGKSILEAYDVYED